MSNRADLAKLLEVAFVRKHVDAMLDHFLAGVEAFQGQKWEGAIAKSGKFIEAALKALVLSVGQTVARGRSFKVDKVIHALEQTPQGTFDDAIRLTIPRACRFAYDVASNRGARHDPDEIDPNQMDATALTAVTSWVLAEMVRFSQKGALDTDRARDMVGRLNEPRYPLFENVDGRLYFHGVQRTARDVILALLLAAHPGRLNRHELIKAVARNNFTENAARVALSRLTGSVDDDGSGNLSLLAPGRQEAEKLISNQDRDRGAAGARPPRAGIRRRRPRRL